MAFKHGVPRGFTGACLNGVEIYSSTSAICQLMIQEYQTDFLSFRNVHLKFKAPGKIICNYDYPPSLFSRTTINNSLRERIKGTGELYIKSEEFMLLTGSNWTGLLFADTPGEHHFVDIAWSAEILENMPTEYPEVYDMLVNITDGLPDRCKVPFHPLDTYMQRLITEMFQLDFTEDASIEIFEERLQRYLNMILREAKECKGIRKRIGEDDWQKVLEARKFIEENTTKHYSIPQISSMIGMSEYNLKKLFPVVTGFSVDEFRKYWLCANAAKKIMQRPDMPLKNFYTEAGYTSESTFVRGFKRICGCTPGELRSNNWISADGHSEPPSV